MLFRSDDGSIYLALVNNSSIYHDDTNGVHYVNYTVPVIETETLEDGSTVTTTTYVGKTTYVYLWDMDSGLNNLTVTIDGVGYYLAANEEKGFYLETVENYSEDKLPSYNSYEYKYDAEDGVFLFHLSEDVSWDGTLTAPAGTIIIIFTNGHTATGDYEHGDMGGVYIFNDAMHICPSAPEIPVTISADFIDLLLLMSGGEISMGSRIYVALGEDLNSVNPAFILPEGTTLYICYNGYTVSDDVVAQLTSAGGSVEFIDCDDLSHDYCEKLGDIVAQPVNQNLMVNF